jgi:dTDP-4-dehydrorhamnose 3,5-epimerase-like enzyme
VGCAKGIHVHPPHVPAGKTAAKWFRSLYASDDADPKKRPYDREQWDVWFFLQGSVEVVLVDLREGLPHRVMRFFADGEDKPGPNNVGVVIPAGVGHGLRVEGSQDAILMYGTSTTFRAEFEGRIASDVETKPLPDSWRKMLSK